jgi:FkbM family methyltransferase
MKLPRNFSRIRLISLTIWLTEYTFFYPKLRRCLKSLPGPKPQSVVLDVGANRGQSVKFFRSLFKGIEIYSFEPSPRIFKLLAGLNIRDFHAFNVGISSTNGVKTFYESSLDEASTFDLPNVNSEWHKTKSRVLGVNKDEMYSSVSVPVRTLDSIIDENEIQRIFLLKIDVEGHEYEVLSGARLAFSTKMIENIQIERHLDDLRINDETRIQNYLKDFGYCRIRSIKHSVGNFYEDIYSLNHNSLIPWSHSQN